jgi:hypothetical protein
MSSATLPITTRKAHSYKENQKLDLVGLIWDLFWLVVVTWQKRKVKAKLSL